MRQIVIPAIIRQLGQLPFRTTLQQGQRILKPYRTDIFFGIQADMPGNCFPLKQAASANDRTGMFPPHSRITFITASSRW